MPTDRVDMPSRLAPVLAAAALLTTPVAAHAAASPLPTGPYRCMNLVAGKPAQALVLLRGGRYTFGPATSGTFRTQGRVVRFRSGPLVTFRATWHRARRRVLVDFAIRAKPRVSLVRCARRA